MKPNKKAFLSNIFYKTGDLSMNNVKFEIYVKTFLIGVLILLVGNSTSFAVETGVGAPAVVPAVNTTSTSDVTVTIPTLDTVGNMPLSSTSYSITKDGEPYRANTQITRAAQFDGSSRYATLNLKNTAGSCPYGRITVEFWFYNSSTLPATNETLYDVSNVCCEYLTNGNLRVKIGDDDNRYVDAQYLPQDDWCYVSTCFSTGNTAASYVCIYIDGVRRDESGWSSTGTAVSLYSSDLYIGRTGNGYRYLGNGRMIKDLKVFMGSKVYENSGARMSSPMSTSSTDYSSLYAYYKLDEVAGTTANYTLNGQNGSYSSDVSTLYSGLNNFSTSTGDFTEVLSEPGVYMVTATHTDMQGNTATTVREITIKLPVPITLDQQSGSGGTESIIATNGDPMPGVTIPTRTNYDFCGYYTERNGGGIQYYTSTGSSARNCDMTVNTTLYAKWEETTLYTITFDANYDGGDTRTQPFGTTVKNLSLNAFVRPGYTFKGWSETSDGSVVYVDGESYLATESDTLYAVWIANPAVTFRWTADAAEIKKLTLTTTGGTIIDWGGTGIGGTTSKISAISSAVSGGTSVFSYNTPGTYTVKIMDNVINSLVLNPLTVNAYIVKYNGNGNTGGATISSLHSAGIAKTLTPNGFTKECTVTYNYNGNGTQNTTATSNCTFSKWNTDIGGIGTDYNDRESVTDLATNGIFNLYAQWTGESITLPTPTKTGSVFGGWYEDAEYTTLAGVGGASYTPTENKTLYAKWNTTLLAQQVSVGDYISYVPDCTSCTVEAANSGTSADQSFIPSNTTLWRVFSVEEDTVKIISASSIGNLALKGLTGYTKAVDTLNNLCGEYVNSTYASSGRSVGCTSSSTGTASTTLYYAQSLTTELEDTYYTADNTIINTNSLISDFGDNGIWLASRHAETNYDIGRTDYYVRKKAGSNPGYEDIYMCGDDGSSCGWEKACDVYAIITLNSQLTTLSGTGTSSTSPYILTAL